MPGTPTEQGKPVKISGGELLPGTVLDNRIEVVRRLSRGVKESVYLCKQLVAPHQTVVLKLLPRGRAGEDPQTTFARFQREILALYSISHPNIVNVYEAINDSEVFGFTMEYVEGGNLDQLLEDGSDLSIERSVEILRQICSGLQKIHECGIIHRALKPKNILLTEAGNVKITDFAVAKMEGQKKLTVQGTVIGTMDYVSPEYVTRGVLDHRLDIYSAGVIGYEMITGTTPFQSDDFIDTLSKRAALDPEAPAHLNPACPKKLSDIILRAVHRDPEHRFQSAAEMLQELDSFLESGGDDDEIATSFSSFFDEPRKESPSVAPFSAGPSTQAARETTRVGTIPEEPMFSQGLGQSRFDEDAFGADPFATPNEPSLDYFQQPQPEQDSLFGPEWDEYGDDPRRGTSSMLYWVSSAILGFGMGWVVLMWLQSKPGF